MRIDWRHDPSAPRARCVDPGTGEQIPLVFLADEEAGVVERWAVDAGGRPVIRDNAPVVVREARAVRIDPLGPDEPYEPNPGG